MFRHWNKPMLWFAGLCAALAVASVVGLAVDDRTLLGAPIWVKPLKFAISSTAYALTWAWLCSLIDHRQRTVRRASVVIVVLLTIELVIITLQALRARRSHFNFATVPDVVLYEVMAVSIVAVWCGALVLTMLVVRSHIQDRSRKLTVAIGAVLSLVGVGLGALMTLPTGAQFEALTAGGDTLGAHTVGAPDGGPGLPLLGWSTTAGDLRIPHFVGIHALQALLLWNLALGLLARWWPRLYLARAQLVCVGGAGFAGLMALLTWQAYRGQPLTSPDGWTMAAFAVLVLGMVAAIFAALRSDPEPVPVPVRETRTPQLLD